MLRDQLVELMPELEGVSGWPSVGQRRTMEELGVAAERLHGSGPAMGNRRARSNPLRQE